MTCDISFPVDNTGSLRRMLRDAVEGCAEEAM